MFLLYKWDKGSYGAEGAEKIPEGAEGKGKYKSFEEAKSNIPKDFVLSKDLELIKTLPHWTIMDEKDNKHFHYIKQEQED